jgi:hypothetical protein
MPNPDPDLDPVPLIPRIHTENITAFIERISTCERDAYS